MRALELQEIVVAAFITVGIFAAYRWAGCINGATTFILIEERAHTFVHVILAVPQDPLVGFLGLVVIRKFLARRGGAQLKVLGQSVDIVIRDFNTRMTAAVARTG